MKFYKIGIICFLILIISVSFVSAQDTNQTNDDLSKSDISDSEISLSDDSNSDILSDNPANFSQLDKDLDIDKGEFNLSKNYKFNDNKTYAQGLEYDFNNTKFVFNGNGYYIDGDSQAKIFIFKNGNITLNNIIFKNSNVSSIVLVNCSLYTNNVTFANNYASDVGASIYAEQSSIYSKNDKFNNNYALKGTDFYIIYSSLILDNATFINSHDDYWSLIYGLNSNITIQNTIFNNLKSKYATVLFNNFNTRIYNSKFYNIKSNITAGAIAVKGSQYLEIQNSEFINVSSAYNGGAIFADISGDSDYSDAPVIINSTLFKNCTSNFGAALLQLGGTLELTNSTFIENEAVYNGVVYLSNSTANIKNNTFNNNQALTGGALFLDNGVYTIQNNNFYNNTPNHDSVIEYTNVFLYDSKYNIYNLTFTNSSYKDIHTFFDRSNSVITQTTANITQDDVLYSTNVQNTGTKIVLNPVIVNANVTDASFDLRDYNLVTPVKNQGSTGSCWAFGTTGAIESAFLKATNTTLILSENNMKNFNSRYSIFGKPTLTEGGYLLDGLSYALSWLGVVNSSSESYDELGKISSIIFPSGAYHILEAVFINTSDINEVKEALIKYGAITIFVEGASKDSSFYNSNTYALYCNNESLGNHFVTLIGWNDTFSKNNFNITPAGDGAWICKNSWGTNWGDEGYFYLSYYDAPLKSQDGVAYIINSTDTYNNLYQYDLSKIDKWYNNSKYPITYLNNYKAMGSEYISAIGTYFSDANLNYTITIYVNDNSLYYQKGKSSHYGYNLIKLDKYISLNYGDNFTVEITSNAIPLVTSTRQYFESGTSVAVFYTNEQEDISKQGCVASIKVYTIDTSNLTANIIQYYNATNFIYLSDAYGANCTIYQNGKALANSIVVGGKAVFDLILSPGLYTMVTQYNNSEILNSVEILETVVSQTYAKITENINLDYYFKLLDTNGSALSVGTVITFIFEGKQGTAKVLDENGTIIITLQKLPKGKYTLIVSNPASNENYTATIEVVSRFSNVANLNMYYFDGSVFKARVYDNDASVLKGGTVDIYINKAHFTAKTDANGYIKFKIPKSIRPGKYTIKLVYQSTSVSKTLKVLQVLKTSKYKVKKSAKRLILKATLKHGKTALKSKVIKFTFRGKTYKAKTNKKGLAKVVIKKSVIKKLKAGKKYTFKVTYLNDAIKSTVSVRK